jgi:hypothetical protein
MKVIAKFLHTYGEHVVGEVATKAKGTRRSCLALLYLLHLDLVMLELEGRENIYTNERSIIF